MTFLEKLRNISEDALVQWDRITIDYEAYAASATRMWFAEKMNVCRLVKYQRGREVPYVTVHGCEVAAWIDNFWAVREAAENVQDFWKRIGIR